MNEAEAKLGARLHAIEFMLANLYAAFCEEHDVSPPVIKAQNDQLRERLAQLAGPPGVDPTHFAPIAEHFGDALQAILVQIEATAEFPDKAAD